MFMKEEKHTEQGEYLDRLIEALARSTRSPYGRFTAEKGWPLLKERLRLRHRRRVWMRVASSAAVVMFCVAGWAAYRVLVPAPSGQETEVAGSVPAPESAAPMTLTFRNERLEDVAVRLSEVYGVPVRVEDDSLRDYRVTATFRTDEPLSELVELLRRATENFDCRQRGDTLLLVPAVR